MRTDEGYEERQQALLAWGRANRRPLPWRNTRDPWAILVSECMLQQTQVSRVEPRWRVFMAEFPSARHYADKPPSRTIELWAGLGYNRRALQLHRAATMATARFDGTLPCDLDGLLELPGVGPYTARAILAFAFELDVGVLDTNAARVLARAFAGRRLLPTEAQLLANRAVPVGTGWAWNQAVLDLGATICTKRNPPCHRCPLRGSCAWVANHCAAPDPAVGSAGASGTQSTFAGSDRQGRGRLVAAMRGGPVTMVELADTMGWPHDPERSVRVADTLVRDGLAIRCDDTYRLPVSPQSERHTALGASESAPS